MMQHVETVEDVVDALGGDTQVAAWLGISQPAVAAWKSREAIPGGWHLRIYARLLAMGIECDPKVFGLTADEASVLQNSLHPPEPERKRPRPSAHV
jgi:hypothetical protein